MVAKTLPAKLYKYRTFSTTTLRMFSQAEVFFAKPASFNDPFDCNPQVYVDVEWREVERLWESVMLLQVEANKAAEMMGTHRYFATEYGGKYDDDGGGTATYLNYLVRDIDAYLKERFKDFGVFSLASNWDNPLMWSHYADEHRGICIEYETDDHRCKELGPVNYRSSRFIHISDLQQWLLKKSAAAERKIFEQYFFAKAPQWRYEREWRAVSPKSGVDDRPFRIRSVFFGLRCDKAIVTTIAKLFSDSKDKPNFHQVTARADGFKLGRYELDADEIDIFGIRESALFAADEWGFDSPAATRDISGQQQEKDG
ncbi:hypothetical protein AWB64_01256 [Caballeronia sordidicola]|uniref:DUF2971 domain-containing protein n=1 Tax=Caballeronia sordidicola TaxID=196367 RepID=A0A158FFN0_CABSO|nr:DUF2971 domain-containing protein [Caballeronia sordidicola]SAL18501.1 hypothetical protein AWB64_01256 [Caballeronia sordidicola]